MENQEQVQTPPQPELSISDLQNVKVLIEMAVRRGAYAATEMSSVGAVFDRLNAFVTAVTAQQNPEGETKSAETAAE